MQKPFDRVSQPESSDPVGDHGAVPGGHEQTPLLNSSAVILQNPVVKQGAKSARSLWKGATNHERLRTTVL